MNTADILVQIEQAVAAALPGAQVSARGGGGHFSIHVISSAFEGMSRLNRQRTVLRAIKHLMAGNGAPVHAVDELVTETP